MPFYDLDDEALRSYRPTVQEPDDFDDFWGRTLAEARTVAPEISVKPVDAGLDLVETFDVTFAGFGGHPIKAWLVLPRGGHDLPGVVTYVGYGGGRGLVHEHLGWAAAGFANLVMDTRGQGSTWGNGGDTPDPVGNGPASPGYMTRGVLDPEGYYYRRVITDAVRAVDLLRALPQVDPTRVAVSGISQGGGLALAVAGLVPGLLAAAIDVPFLCHFRRAVAIAGTDPYGEITRYLSVHRGDVEQVFTTLSYIDGVNFARRATAPAMFSVALMDPVCPPSTVFAAHNLYGSHDAAAAVGPVTIDVYPFNQHEGGQGHQLTKQLPWLRAIAGLTRPTTAGPATTPTLTTVGASS
ncbi:cephalosporin-C deacetylase [Sanguibacter gelidistatuariae]|uniref:Cephalosporin-C deacetylase n=1 Tax=Sanguibacter gelidistatuariae TaxID=1814289 RepID=A0A1G6VM21_9MICO|nr:acetylxylan esterase [Sanguibacter gelidistatuariae]SDD53935.1 cephalosporin-C deacetylase [Sanguibacter gelidistatuariae]